MRAAEFLIIERPQKRERTTLKKNLKEGPKTPPHETPSLDSHILYAGEDSD